MQMSKRKKENLDEWLFIFSVACILFVGVVIFVSAV